MSRNATLNPAFPALGAGVGWDERSQISRRNRVDEARYSRPTIIRIPHQEPESPVFLGKNEDRHLMEKYADELKLLVELDDRHDELLRELDDLDKQVESVLAFWLAEREARLKAA